ncbi:LysR family transcriptional regulator [Nocardiopsis aegyptia]|uniref:LysR family transcriptional regulator n=1 Tax=Nocardiopsis aegyptia TaxID=220378 RepID=UPI003671269D
MTDWDLRKLRVLRTLDELGTVRATATALHMTPSAVSQQLSSLAAQVGVPLLEAHGRRVRLTDAAHVLLRHTDLVLAQLERAEAELDGFARGESGHVRVGSFATAIPSLVVPALTALRRDHPGLTVRVHQAEAAEVYDLLAAGEVDIGLSLAAEAPTGQDGRYDRTELLTDPLDVALPAHHRLANSPGLRLADLADEPWIYGDAGPWHDITVSACAQAGFAPRQAHVAADWRAILDMVAAGMGTALLPRLAAPERTPGVALRVLAADQPRRHVVTAVRAGASRRPQIVQVTRYLTETAQGIARSNVQLS